METNYFNYAILSEEGLTDYQLFILIQKGDIL